MLTKEDEQKIALLFRKEMRATFLRIEKKLDKMNVTIDRKEFFGPVEKKLDEFLVIMKHFAKEQKILIKKMREIEDYFDPQTKN